MALADASFEYVLDVRGTALAGSRAIADDQHDVYLIDQKLPDGTGIEVIRRARASGVRKPLILMTGYGSDALDAAALREGAADYVEKHMLAVQLDRSIRYAIRDWDHTRLLRERDEQLRQAQKMEAIGRLAGGVAHDFNNLLTAIIGYADLVAERLEPGGEAAADIHEIRKAADSAAALTRQLLAFSRKQYLNTTVLNLNEIASDLLRMLPRVIGENIRTGTRLSPDIWLVKADPSQMEQVLINLVLNARDAMPQGGDLCIEIANVHLEEKRVAAERLALAPGRYVTLCVTDTGFGMDAETMAKACEPFFTTKPKGKGTGLGLATVYGIIEQTGGALSIESRVGHGTTVRIYLPVTSATEHPAPGDAVIAVAGGGHESILLVEDDASVRDIAVRALRRRGYGVYEASSAEDALAIVEREGLAPDLLITDVLMPGASGPALAARLLDVHPSMHVLYMSGYTNDSHAVELALRNGALLLAKPFTPQLLAEQVRRVLDAPAERE